MKKIISLVLIAFTIITFLSCSNQEDGKWDDNIKLSTKNVSFNSNENTVIVTTGRSNWWLVGIGLNGTLLDLQEIDGISQNFIVAHSDFTVERIDGNVIKITMNANTTTTERILDISLQNGNYFDGIKVTQKAN